LALFARLPVMDLSRQHGLRPNLYGMGTGQPKLKMEFQRGCVGVTSN